MNKKIFYIVFFLLFIANYSHLNANILENKKTWLLIDAQEKVKGTADEIILNDWLKKEK